MPRYEFQVESRVKENFKHGLVCEVMPTRKFMTHRDFTLIELLIVIAIIAILAAMLLPALKKARDRVKGITCTSNLKQCAYLWHLYASDYNGLCPLYNNYYGPADSGFSVKLLTWADTLIAYKYTTHNSRFLTCPCTTGIMRTEDGNYRYIYGAYLHGTSVANNLLNVNNNVLILGGDCRVLNYKAVSRPSTTILLSDSVATADDARQQIYMMRRIASYLPIARHHNQISMAFVDGSARQMSGDDTYSMLQADPKDYNVEAGSAWTYVKSPENVLYPSTYTF
jgi:prepilin-type N-terminal cleavage/methylation domain-containing protein